MGELKFQKHMINNHDRLFALLKKYDFEINRYTFPLTFSEYFIDMGEIVSSFKMHSDRSDRENQE